MSFAGFQGLSYLNEFSFILFIHHNIHIYFELCTYCKIWDIYLLWNMNSVKYLLFYMELFCDMFGSVLECYELTHISWSSLIPRQDHASLSSPQLSDIKIGSWSGNSPQPRVCFRPKFPWPRLSDQSSCKTKMMATNIGGLPSYLLFQPKYIISVSWWYDKILFCDTPWLR